MLNNLACERTKTQFEKKVKRLKIGANLRRAMREYGFTSTTYVRARLRHFKSLAARASDEEMRAFYKMMAEKHETELKRLLSEKSAAKLAASLADKSLDNNASQNSKALSRMNHKQ